MDRIVSVTSIDLLSLYGVILNVGGEAVTAVEAESAEGNFKIASAEGKLLATEPVKVCDFAAEVTSATLYFVPAYNFEGFTVAGEAVETDEIEADGKSLYKAELASGAVTLTKVGF